MTYVAIMAWDAASKRVTKYMDFAGEEQAASHVSHHSNDYPDAFVAETPAGPAEHWTVNATNDGVTTDWTPPPVLTPEEAARQAALTTPLTAMQFHAMIDIAEIRPAILSAIENMSSPDKQVAQSKMEYSSNYYRNDSLMVALSAAVGLTETQVDNMWIAALNIE
jgi:hypothetical protein